MMKDDVCSSALGSQDTGGSQINDMGGLDLRANSPMSEQSRTPEITVKQWAILSRCKSRDPVSVQAIMQAASDWFAPPLSLAEVMSTMDFLIERDWLEFDPTFQTALATAQGRGVIASLARPVSRADGWNAYGAWRADEAGSSASAGCLPVGPK
ncbi:MAG: hypothetical protein JHD10_06440 [Sphingomonadaceae bacterium]|nr:hypothetical protein [Sphingomonadaceae bacterium]